MPANSSQSTSISKEPVRPPDRKPRLWMKVVPAKAAAVMLDPTSAAACKSRSWASEQPAPVQLGRPM